MLKISQFKQSKVFWLITLSYAVFLIAPLFAFIGTPYTLESNLSTLDLSRSSLIFIFDSALLLFLIIVPFGLLLLVAVKRRLKILRRISLVILILLLVSSVFTSISLMTQSNAEVAREKPLANKVIVITFDGTRADAFWEHADFIINHRNESAWARRIVCTYPTVTYPNHVSLFTGTWPQYHGTESNPAEYRSVQFMLRVYREPHVEDLFEVAEEYGIVTAIFAAPSTLASILGEANTYRISGGRGYEMMSAAMSFIEDNKETIDTRGLLMFIHLIDPDDIMHQYGTGSTEYYSTIKAMADLVGDLYNKIHELGWEKDTVIIVTADHGAIGNRHYGVWPPLVADIPLWMWGKPFAQGREIGGGRIIDIAPTIAFILGIRAPAQSRGIILYRAFNETYVRGIRGELDLQKLANSALRNGLISEYIEILIWGLSSLTMIWVMLIELAYLGRNIRKLIIEEKRLKKKA